jgi:CRP-like cAMP-binding protein
MSSSPRLSDDPVAATSMRAMLRASVLFRDFSDGELAPITVLVGERRLTAGSTLVREGEPARELFLVRSGRVEVTKRAPGADTDHRLTTLGAGDTIGEVALVDRAPRSASISALEPTVVAVLDMDALDAALANEPVVRARMLGNLSVFVGRRLRDVSEVGVAALERELALARTRVAMGTFLTYVICIMVAYGFVLRLIGDLASSAADTTAFSVPVILGFALPIWLMVRRSGEPLATYGLTWHGARAATHDGILWSVPIIAGATLLKLVMIRTLPALADVPVFSLGGWLDPRGPVGSWQYVLGANLLYFAVVPIQEFVVRGAMQGPLERFLVGPHARAKAVLIANFLFIASHLYLSTSFAVTSFVPGLVWGALYARHRTLVAPIVSHWIFGSWAFFVLGFDRVLVLV